jgi:TPR repeat protein
MGEQAGFEEYLSRAEAGSSAAQAVVAFMYLNRWLVDENYLVTAANWATKSATAGDPYGRWVLAWALLEQGEIESGMPELIQAAESGFLPALYDLGMFLRDGAVFLRDSEIGCALLKYAASKGHSPSRVGLREAAKLGAFGVKEKLISTITAPLIKPVRFVLWFLFRLKFTEKDLVYIRSMHVRNSIKREYSGEAVSFAYEDLLDEALKKI